MKLGECIAEARIYRELTQTQLAERLGIPYRNRAMVGAWESGKRNPIMKTVPEIGKALNIAFTLRDGEWSWRPA